MTKSRARAARDTILVTGPSGKVGRRLIPLLTRRGLHVRAASRTPLAERPSIQPVHFDWTNAGTYDAAVKGVHGVFIVAGSIVTPRHADLIEALLAKARREGAERVVLLSSFGADQGPADSPLRRNELVVEASGLWSTILRPVAFMQNFSEGIRWREAFAQGIRERDEIVGPGGEGKVSYVSTEDIAAVAATALTSSGAVKKAYAPAGPEPLTLGEVAGHIAFVTGRQIKYVETDRTPIRDALVAAGAPLDTAERNSQIFTNAFSSNIFAVRNDDVFEATGRQPVSFLEFAVGAAAAWRR